MARPFYPHTLDDVVRAVDGALGLVVADMPDGSLWVLKRNRKTAGYRLTHYADTARSRVLSTEEIGERTTALDRMGAAIGLRD